MYTTKPDGTPEWHLILVPVGQEDSGGAISIY